MTTDVLRAPTRIDPNARRWTVAVRRGDEVLSLCVQVEHLPTGYYLASVDAGHHTTPVGIATVEAVAVERAVLGHCNSTTERYPDEKLWTIAESRPPGVKSPEELIAERVTSAIGAVVEGYRNGRRFRVMEALAEARDYVSWSVGRTDVNVDWSDPEFRAQLVMGVEEIMSRYATAAE